MGGGMQDGFRGPQAARIVGISYRQLDYWARTGLVTPSLASARGTGTRRLYSFQDLLVLRLIKRLLDTGVGLRRIREAVEFLREKGEENLAALTLVSDGNRVYACRDRGEVLDVVAKGQAVFAIALSSVVREVESVVREMGREAVAAAAVPPEAGGAWEGARTERRDARP